MIVYDKNGEISLGDIGDIQFELDELLKRANLHDSEDDIRIWNNLKRIVCDLENPEIMKLPYSRKYYPQLIILVDQIREQLQINMADSTEKSKSFRLFRFEKIK